MGVDRSKYSRIYQRGVVPGKVEKPQAAERILTMNKTGPLIGIEGVVNEIGPLAKCGGGIFNGLILRREKE